MKLESGWLAALKVSGRQSFAAAEAAYVEADGKHREIQRGRIFAGVVFAFACGAVGLTLHMPPWGVVGLFLGGVGVVKLLTL